MNSRERVLTAIDRAEPDRVPVDFSANADTLARLYAELGCPSHHALLDRLGVDIVDLRGVVENYWGWRTRRMETAMGIEDSFCEFVLKDCRTVDELAGFEDQYNPFKA